MEIYDRGLRLKELREKCRLSQQEAAKRLDVTRSTISAYERNTKTPSVEMLVKLAFMYHASVDYILGLENRTSIFVDDLTESQQKTITKMIDILRAEFLSRQE